MQVSYENSKIEKKANKFSGNIADALEKRISAMSEFATLEELRHTAGHYHELAGNLKGQLACSITGNWRIVFAPDHDPVPVKPDGGLDWTKVTAVKITDITDYH